MKDICFGTVGSPHSAPKKPGGSISAILQISELGLDALEIGWVHSVRVSEKTCGLINKTARDNQVLLSIHAPYYINLNASEEEWPKSKKRLLDAAYYGHLAGATDVIFHPGSFFENNPDKVFPRVIKRLTECVQELRLYNNPIILRPETMGKPKLMGSLMDVLNFSKEIDGVKPCLDLPHLHARTGDSTMNSYKEWSDLLSTYAKILGANSLSELHIHLSGIQYSEHGEIRHIPLRESDLDIISIFKALQDFSCKGRILCESPLLEDDALYMQNLWEEIN